ncbi:MAG: DUF4097 family beta strand repeat-containing protein [Terriglobales bacterium]
MPETNLAAQPAASPSPPPPRPRSLTGPVLLILVGVALLLCNAGFVSCRLMAHYFALYWPLLIILWGVIKLVEHMQWKRAGVRAPGIGVGGFFLLVFLIIAGLIASAMDRVDWKTVRTAIVLDDDFFGGMFGKSYDFQQQIEQSFPASGELIVNCQRGAVAVRAWDQNQIKVVVGKKVRAQEAAEAARVDEATPAKISISGNVVNVDTGAASHGSSIVTTNLEIYVPRKAALEVFTGRGDVAVQERDGDVKINASHGDVTVENVKGNATVMLRHGDVRAAHIMGDVSIDGRISDSTVSDIDGNVNLTGDFFGDMNLSRITKSVRFRSSRTDLEVARLDGNMLVQTGDLHAVGVTGPMRLLTKSKDIHVENISGDLRLENRNGVVEVHPSKELGSISITNDKGDIRLAMPAGVGFQLDARTRHGDIHSDYPELKISSDHGESTASGAVGSGGARVQITNRYGNVDVRKS